MAQSITFNILLGMARHKALACLSLLDNALAFAVAYLIVKLADGDVVQGVVGVCFAAAVSAALCRGIGFLVCACWLVQVPLWKYVTHVLLPALTVAAVAGAGLALVKYEDAPTSWPRFVVDTGAYVIFYAVGCAFLFGPDLLPAKRPELVHEGTQPH
jgi:hypothetical protein